LSELDLSDADLSGATLDYAELRGTDLREADLSGANLLGANLIEANLSGARLVGSNLKWANLTGAILDEADLSGADLTGAILTGADLTNVKLTAVILNEANLIGASLWGVDLSGVHLSGADLSGANLVGAQLSGAYLGQVGLLSGADLSGADMRGIDLLGTNLSGAKLRGANLSRANLSQAQLDATLAGADLTKADLSGAKLAGAFLAGAKLDYANLSSTDLVDVELNGVSLLGAQLRQAKLLERKNDEVLQVELLGSKYNQETEWPWSFLPPPEAAYTDIEEARATLNRCGDKKQLSDTLTLFNWANYIDERILAQFELECGVQVVQDFYSSNEQMIDIMRQDYLDYDLLIPVDFMVQLMIEEDLLAELDKANIANIKNMNPEQIGLYYDPKNKYSLPYQWGTTGIAYNVKAFPDEPPNSWAVLFDPEQLCQHKGLVSMLDDQRETIGAALKYLGYSYNDTEPAHHEEARTLLLAQQDCLAGYKGSGLNQLLAEEELMLAHAWSGGTAKARSVNENIAFVIPREGGLIWQVNMAIPAEAPHKYTAEIFINYLLDPQMGTVLNHYIYAFTPNQAAESLLHPTHLEVLEKGGLLLDKPTRERLEWIKVSDESAIFSETWQAVQGEWQGE
jgi:spermidine/putrescine transport system substrate-binding protein